MEERVSACENAELENTIRIDDQLDCIWVSEIQFNMGPWGHCQATVCQTLDQDHCNRSNTCRWEKGSCVKITPGLVTPQEYASESKRVDSQKKLQCGRKANGNSLIYQKSCSDAIPRDAYKSYDFCKQIKSKQQ